eukprot:TRINITY_DN3550_c0_g1_i1.p1 TRINITY_DN3550_c0_g1~~TRINITY_DN3550_c0_g1_i1.p1  ORF type:complete len:704 (+),score=153.85 TRINITY_DN3550_c0_g1_i1:47-2158(+)
MATPPKPPKGNDGLDCTTSTMSSLMRMRSDTSGSNASVNAMTLPLNDELPSLVTRLRSGTTVQRPRRDRGMSIKSRSSAIDSTGSEVGDITGHEIGLGMPDDDSFPSFSRQGSRFRKLGERRISISTVNSTVDEGIGEALQQISNSFISRGPSLCLSPKPSSSVLVTRTKSSSLVFPDVPVVPDEAGDDRDGTQSDGSLHHVASASELMNLFDSDFTPVESDCTDVSLLQKSLDFRMTQLQAAVEMGQLLHKEMQTLKDDMNTLMDERDFLLNENADVMEEVEVYRGQNLKLANQLREAKAEVSEHKITNQIQAEEMAEVKEEMIQEKEVMEKKQEDLLDNAKWQEEKFVAAVEAAEKAKPNNEQIMAMKAMMAEGSIRKTYFDKLRLWRDENSKRRQCYHVLQANLHQTEQHEELVRDRYFSMLVSLAERSLLRKSANRRALEDDEANARLQISEDFYIDYSLLLLDFGAMGILSWQVCQEEAEQQQQDAELLSHDIEEQHRLGASEGKWRRDIFAMAWEGISTIYQASSQSAMDDLISSVAESNSRAKELARIREQWQTEAEEFSSSLATKISESDEFQQKLAEAETKISIAEQTIILHEQEITKLRDDLVESNHANIAIRESLHKTEADLANARSLFEFQHVRAKQRVDHLIHGEAVTPCLRNAIQLVASLKQKAEDTRRFSETGTDSRVSSPTATASVS